MPISPYHIKIAPKAYRQYQELPNKQKKTIIQFLEALAINPRPPGAQKMEGLAGLYIEVLDGMRLIYKVENQDILLLIIRFHLISANEQT